VKIRAIVVCIAALLLSTSAWGQQPPNLSGVWKLDVDHSDYGDLQGPSSRTDIIEQRNGEITDTVAAIYKHRNQHYALHFSTDGRKTVFPAGAEIHIPPVRLFGIAAVWKDNTLVVTEWLHVDDYDLPARYLYDLSPDRSSLTMTLFLGAAKSSATFVFRRSSRSANASRHAQTHLRIAG
jgi:hypothetical protein